MDNICVIEIGGRLGNILNDLSCGYEYALEHNLKPYIKVFSEFWNSYYKTYEAFHVFPEYTGQIDNTFIVVKQPDGLQPLKPIPYQKGMNVFLIGSWESQDYFPKKQFVKDFLSVIPEETENKIRQQYPFINDACGISIRLGDYLNYQDLFLIPKMEWYVNTYEKYFNGQPCILFSDEINKVESILGNRENFHYHKPEHEGGDIYRIVNPLENLYTLAMCKNHICSMSTFSWWGAQLLEKPDSVNIFPDRRFKNGQNESDYIPGRYIKEKAEYYNED